jgi:hypothetical protein
MDDNEQSMSRGRVVRSPLPPSLTDSTGFLLGWVSTHATERFNGALAAVGLTPHQLGVLTLLIDGPQKQALIDKMVAIAQQDAPWSFGYFPYASAAVQHWLYNARPTVLVRDPGRYLRLDPAERMQRQQEWNRPLWWPMVLGVLVIVAVLLGAWRSLRLRERTNARGEVLAA